MPTPPRSPIGGRRLDGAGCVGLGRRAASGGGGSISVGPFCRKGLLCNLRRHGLNRRLHVGSRNVQVRHRADRAGTVASMRMPRTESGDQLGRRRPGRVHAERRPGSCRSSRVPTAPSRSAQAVGQPPGVGVVVGQALDVVLQGVEGRGREDAGLPHAAAEELAVPHAPRDQVARAGQRRADRRAQPLAEADADRVEVPAQSAGGDARWPRRRSRAGRRRGASAGRGPAPSAQIASTFS